MVGGSSLRHFPGRPDSFLQAAQRSKALLDAYRLDADQPSGQPVRQESPYKIVESEFTC